MNSFFDHLFQDPVSARCWEEYKLRASWGILTLAASFPLFLFPSAVFTEHLQHRRLHRSSLRMTTGSWRDSTLFRASSESTWHPPYSSQLGGSLRGTHSAQWGDQREQMILNIPLGVADAQSGWKTGRAEPEKPSADPLQRPPIPSWAVISGVPGKESRQGASRCQIDQGSCPPEDRPPGTREMTASCTWPPGVSYRCRY